MCVCVCGGGGGGYYMHKVKGVLVYYLVTLGTIILGGK